MHKIRIENFGPIKEFEKHISKYNIYIGAQAVGKSTISKLIYFFRSLQGEFSKLLRSDLKKLDYEKELYNIIRKKFLNTFGTTKHRQNLSVRYDYGNNIQIGLQVDDFGFARLTLYSEMKKAFYLLIDKRLRMNYELQVIDKKIKSALSSSEAERLRDEKEGFFKEIDVDLNKLFSDDYIPIYIPAGRSLATVFSEKLQAVDVEYLDFLMGRYINLIFNFREYFNKSYKEIIEERKRTTVQRVANLDDIEYSAQVIKKILKGEYRCERGEERIYINSKDYVQIRFASSGQQESVWILLLIFKLILERSKTFLVIEEPEAHLYPLAQYDLVRLIALMANTTKSQVLLTTHSPYILTSFNNLLLANRVSNKKPLNVSKIIDKRIWINSDDLMAYAIDNGTGSPIMDEDMGIIRAEEIDKASLAINKEFDQLIEFEDL